MDRLIEEPLTTSLRRLAVALVLFDVRYHPSIEDRLAIRLGIEPAIEIEIRTFQLDGRVVDGRLAMGVFGHRQAFPLHPGIEDP
jgi:hypothetical protein